MSIKDEVHAYLSNYRHTNICFPKLCVKDGKITEKEEYSSLISSLFGTFGEKEGIETWVIQTCQAKPQKIETKITTLKELSSHANYIFLQTSVKKKGEMRLTLEAEYEYTIFYWLGNPNNTSINFSTAYYISVFSYDLKPKEIFREESNDESIQFKELFQ
jgi:hypothetical protein